MEKSLVLKIVKEQEFKKGDVVVVFFPFSDLSSSKKRPALIVSNLTGEDKIVSQITSISRSDEHSIIIKEEHFQQGKLPVNSYVRPNKLFTADKSIILYKIGTLKESKIKEIEKKIIKIFNN